MDNKDFLEKLENYVEKKEYSEALKLLDEILSKESRCEYLHLYKAICLRYSDNGSDALKSFDDSILLNPNYGMAFAAKGNYHYLQREFELALKCYTQANKLNERINVYEKETLKFILVEHEISIHGYEYAVKNAGSNPLVMRRKSSLETYEKLKSENVFN